MTTYEMSAFEPPPATPQEVRMCAGGAAEPIVLRGFAPAARAAALRGGLTVAVLADASALAIAPAEALVEALMEADELGVPMSCTHAHEQTVALALTYAPAMPPLRVPLHIVCGAPLSMPADGERASEGAVVSVGVGEATAAVVTGAWRGADVRATLLADSAYLAAAIDGDVVAAADATVPSWMVPARGVAPGSATLAITAHGPSGSPAPGCTRHVPLHVRVGAYVIECPSSTILAGESMLCYALAATGDGTALAPAPAVLAGMRFEWSVRRHAEGGRGDHGGMPLRVAPVGQPAFAVELIAEAAGSVQVDVVATSLDGSLTFTASAALRVEQPSELRLHPDLIASRPTLVPPHASVPLGAALPEGALRWSFCAPPPGAGDEAAVLSDTGVLSSGGVLGPLCVLVADGPQRAMLHIEVAAVAQLRLLTSDGELFRGGLEPTTASTSVCAGAYDALGRRFAPHSLPPDRLDLSLVDAEHAVRNATSDDGRCIELTPSDEWLHRPSVALIAVTFKRVIAASTRLAARSYVLLHAAAAPSTGSAASRIAITPTGGVVPIAVANAVPATPWTSAHAASVRPTRAVASAPPRVAAAHNTSTRGTFPPLPELLSAPPGLVVALVVLVLAALATLDLCRSTRRPLPRLNPRASGPSLRGPYSPRHASPAPVAKGPQA